jgi:hypothetical protein
MDDQRQELGHRAEEPWVGPGGASFGMLLRYLRETFPERTGRNRPGAPKVRLTALALIECLTGRGYPITSGYYSELERGTALPKDAKAFMAAVSECLELNPDERSRLLRQLAYEIIRARLDDLAAEVFER